MPLVSPEKYAFAIEQKKMLPAATSVNGRAVLAPPQFPVSARRAPDAAVINTLTTTSMINLFSLILISQPLKHLSINAAPFDPASVRTREREHAVLSANSGSCLRIEDITAG